MIGRISVRYFIPILVGVALRNFQCLKFKEGPLGCIMCVCTLSQLAWAGLAPEKRENLKCRKGVPTPKSTGKFDWL